MAEIELAGAKCDTCGYISPLSPRMFRFRGQLTKLKPRNNEVRVRKGVNYANISLSLSLARA